MTRLGTIVFMLACIGLTGAASARPDEPLSTGQQEQLLQEGLDAFAEGLAQRERDPAMSRAAFSRAADRWTVLVDHGIVNGPLLYDLGNAQVQAGALGHGIATYLRAQQFMPGDARLAENLAHARTLVETRFKANRTSSMVSTLAFWHRWSLPTRIAVFGVAWFGLWGMLVLRRTGRFSGWRWVALPAAVAAVLFGLSAGLDLIGSDRTGVLVQDGVIVRKGDAATYAPRFEEPVHDGVEFRILEERPSWLHVEFPDGQDGWVPRDAAEVVLVGPNETAQA